MKTWGLILVAMLVSAASLSASAAQTLTTPGYIVTLTAHCEEGEVGCAHVTYHGVSRSSGQAITLPGKTVMVMCADGVTPCHIGDYQFHSGPYLYSVYPDGRLVVTRDDKILVDQSGAWSP